MGFNKKFKEEFLKETKFDYKSKLTPEDIYKKIDEINLNKKEAIAFGKQVSDYLGVEELAIEYEKFVDDSSRLELKPKARIVVGESSTYKLPELLDCVAHEYRHAFQIYYSQLMNDKLAQLWKEELSVAVTSSNIKGHEDKYMCQAIEIDAWAFAQVYLKRTKGLVIRHKDKMYQMLIDAYKNKYRDRL